MNICLLRCLQHPPFDPRRQSTQTQHLYGENRVTMHLKNQSNSWLTYSTFVKPLQFVSSSCFTLKTFCEDWRIFPGSFWHLSLYIPLHLLCLETLCHPSIVILKGMIPALSLSLPPASKCKYQPTSQQAPVTWEAIWKHSGRSWLIDLKVAKGFDMSSIFC